ncbi:MAG: hypothetical protein NTV63_00880 [Candidatus Woesearchaeota archaeon]|nr:hypothetical protein [Candidatus Woesearchaeota archaeon]
MSEKAPVVENLSLSYSGLFNAKELYSTINSWFKEKGYDRREIKNEEHVYPQGKFIDIELQPYKKVSDYAKIVIRIQLTMKDVKDVDIEKEKHKLRLNQGRVDFTFDSYLETDYESRWEQTPFYFLLRTIYDKFIYRSYTRRFEEKASSDLKELYEEIKSFLNMARFTTR